MTRHVVAHLQHGPLEPVVHHLRVDLLLLQLLLQLGDTRVLPPLLVRSQRPVEEKPWVIFYDDV